MDLKNLNLKYALANIGYMLFLSGMLGFAYNYLSQSGFSDGTIGTVLTVLSFIGTFLGPVAGDLVDRSTKITQKKFITATLVISIIFAIILLFIPEGSFLIVPVAIIAFAFATLGTPLLNGMAFIYEKSGGVINYGLCRGLGSAAYAIGANVVGRLWAVIGRNTLPIWMVIMAILTIVAIQLMPNPPKQPQSVGSKKEQSISLLQFFSKYKKVTIVLCSLILMYFCHFLIQNFIAKVIGNFASADIEMIQGNALFIQAIVELPTMFGFTFIMRKLSIQRILVIASIFYSLKHVLVLLCNNVPMFYATMVLQMLSYAALTPATVYFANQVVNEADMNKGQAVFGATATAGGLVASFIGGWMFQFFSVSTALLVGTIASIAGTVLMILGTRGISSPSTARVRLKR